jgi:hypothetical protein
MNGDLRTSLLDIASIVRRMQKSGVPPTVQQYEELFSKLMYALLDSHEKQGEPPAKKKKEEPVHQPKPPPMSPMIPEEDLARLHPEIVKYAAETFMRRNVITKDHAEKLISKFIHGRDCLEENHLVDLEGPKNLRTDFHQKAYSENTINFLLIYRKFVRQKPKTMFKEPTPLPNSLHLH